MVKHKQFDLIRYKKRNLKPSSVFILIFETITGREILFLKRSSFLEHHKDEICFPGGSYEFNDKDLLDTAFREVEEETGIKKNDIEFKFSLKEEVTRTKFVIKPFVGVIKKEVEIVLDNYEIDDYFKLPLDVFLDKKNIRSYCFLNYNNKLVVKPAFFYNGKLIWGATANILNELLEKI